MNTLQRILLLLIAAAMPLAAVAKPRASLKACVNDVDCRTSAADDSKCDAHPAGVCVKPGEEFTKHMGKACKVDDDCSSALLCDGGTCQLVNKKK